MYAFPTWLLVLLKNNMYFSYVPKTVTKKLRYQFLAGLLLTAVIGVSSYQLTLPNTSHAAQTYSWDTASNFASGTNSRTSATQFPGDVTLANKAGAYTESTKEEFEKGGTKPLDELSITGIVDKNGGEVALGQEYRYTTATTPALGNNYVLHSFLANNLLYVSTWGGGLTVINTQGTVDPADDTLVQTYTTATTPALGNNYVLHSFLANNLLYVSTVGGLTVINTQGTVDPADDTLVQTYTTATTPALGNNYVLHSFLANNLLYVSTRGGLTVINLDNQYNPQGIYTSRLQSITSAPTTTFAFDATQTAGQSTALSYRLGDSEAAWIDDFDDNSVSEYAGDFYGWGGFFQTAEESGGTMKLTNPNADDNSTWIDTGKPDGYFPIGTEVTARFRVNTNATELWACVFDEDWWDDDGCPDIIPNEWTTTSFTTASIPFSKIGFDIWWNPGSWNNSTDSLEIDYIQIELPDSAWSSWSTPCTDPTSCPIDPTALIGNDWMQYQLNLTTADTNTTPTVNSVTYSNGYESVGTYTSSEQAFTKDQDLITFAANVTTPAGTTVAFSYTTNHGNTWHDIDNNSSFPEDARARSFQWRAILTTTNPTVTPVIHEISLTVLSSRNTTTSTSRAAQIKHNDPTIATSLQSAEGGKTNSEQVNGDNRYKQTEIIRILKEVVIILQRMKLLQEEDW
ncbi:MAG: hypothetical protein RLZZ230_117 [Candidatus Parcubacteria bacterium]|jgi:hypothetical protein